MTLVLAVSESRDNSVEHNLRIVHQAEVSGAHVCASSSPRPPARASGAEVEDGRREGKGRRRGTRFRKHRRSATEAGARFVFMPASSEASGEASGEASQPLLAVDQLDLGLLRVLLLDENDADDAFRISSCHIAVSKGATHLAIGYRSRLLLLSQHGDAPPLPVRLQAGDEVRCLAFADDSHTHDGRMLIAGFQSGRISAFAQNSTLLWSVRPTTSPVLQVHTDARGAEVRLLCLQCHRSLHPRP